nr:probable peptidoglycan D,D-transpeptidase PenA [Nerophis lumbriciformis]
MNARLWVVLGLAATWILAASVRLYQLQVLHHESYSEQARQQHQRVVSLDPPRGTIYDARGRELSVSVEVDSAFADPTRVEDPAATAAALAPLLGQKRATLERMLDGKGQFVWVSRKLDPPLAESVRGLDLAGVSFVRESKRYYPLRGLAAPVLGYVGTDNQGLGGLESRYDRAVASEPGRRRVVRDARLGTVLHPNWEETAPKAGRDLHLTLDGALQHIVERELEAAVKKLSAKRGTVVMLDVRDGSVLAMASWPSFDPNRYGDFPKESWRNPAVADAYEPGSTFKMVTLAAALEAGKVDTLDVFDCEMGGLRLSGHFIRDHKPFGLLTVREVIAKSSNVGTMKLAFATGRKDFYAAIETFGFGQPTGIDLPGESPGLLRSEEQMSRLSMANIAFGQGISVTPLQLANAFAAIANGGWLYQPYVVSVVGDTPRRPTKPRRVALSTTTLRQVRSVLESVVIEGTGKRAAIDGFRVAGKTGTAQKAIPGVGYAPRKYVASFAGFAPVDDPLIAGVVMFDEPWPQYHGGAAAAPVWGAIVRQMLLYMGAQPLRERPQSWPGEPRSVPLPPTIVAAAPTEAGAVPDFAGLTARQAIHQSSAAGLKLALNGHGFVSRQSPSPGTSHDASAGVVELWLTAEAPRVMPARSGIGVRAAAGARASAGAP